MDTLLIILLADDRLPALAETAAAGHIHSSAARDVRGLDVAYTTRLSRLHRFFRRSVQ
jgi:hypothetical protein